MLTLSRSRQYFFLNGEIPKHVKESIDNVTSFYVKGYEKTDKFLSGAWDGKQHLLRQSKNGSNYFPFGLMSIVEEVLKLWNIPYKVRDETTEDTLKMEPIKPEEAPDLRDYQVEALNKLITNCYNSSGVISLPTGAGKTRCALFWAKRLNLPFYVLVHRVELLRQWRDEIEAYFGYSPSLIGAGDDVEGDRRATVAMVQTLNAKVKKNKEWCMSVGLLIIDECHTVPAITAYDVCMRIDAKYRLGLSATPTRSDGAELKIFAACGSVASSVTVESLVSDSFLAKPVFRMEKIPVVKVGYDQDWNEIYKQGIVLNFDRNQRIADISEEYLSKSRQVYIHVSRIDHGKILEGMIEGAVFVSGSTKKEERKGTITDFKSGRIRCLISTLLKEGVSIDGISCLVYGAGGKSEVSVIQTIGRALRVDPVFSDAIIIDFFDRGNRILENHTQDRVLTYRRTYGELYQF